MWRVEAKNLRASSLRLGLLWLLLSVTANPASAEVDLSLRPTEAFAKVGEPFIVELVATSTIGSDEAIASMSVILTWDADVFVSINALQAPGVSWMVLGFLPEPDGINTFTNDGDVILTGLAQLGNNVQASADGTVIARLEFVALHRMASTSISIPSEIGNLGETLVTAAPGENKVGQLEGTSLPVAECGVPDSDFDGDVDLLDAAGFERCLGGVDVEIDDLCACVFDLDEGMGDEDVDIADWAAFTLDFSVEDP